MCTNSSAIVSRTPCPHSKRTGSSRRETTVVAYNTLSRSSKSWVMSLLTRSLTCSALIQSVPGHTTRSPCDTFHSQSHTIHDFNPCLLFCRPSPPCSLHSANTTSIALSKTHCLSSLRAYIRVTIQKLVQLQVLPLAHIVMSYTFAATPILDIMLQTPSSAVAVVLSLIYLFRSAPSSTDLSLHAWHTLAHFNSNHSICNFLSRWEIDLFLPLLKPQSSPSLALSLWCSSSSPNTMVTAPSSVWLHASTSSPLLLLEFFQSVPIGAQLSANQTVGVLLCNPGVTLHGISPRAQNLLAPLHSPPPS